MFFGFSRWMIKETLGKLGKDHITSSLVNFAITGWFKSVSGTLAGICDGGFFKKKLHHRCLKEL